MVSTIAFLFFADEYPAMRFRGGRQVCGGPIFGYEIRLRNIPFHEAGVYVFHFRCLPNEEMSLLLYTQGKKFLYVGDDEHPPDDGYELTHLKTSIEAILVDRQGRTLCSGTGLPLHGDINGNPNGWILLVLSCQEPKLGNLGNSCNSERLSKLLKRLVDERGFEPPASSLRTVGKIS